MFDFAFVAVCLAGAILSGYLFYLDLWQPGVLGLGRPLATVIHREDEVRRKPASSYLWSAVDVGDRFFYRDSLQVGHGSRAVVELDSGRLLEVNENSLVVFEKTKELALKFLRGDFIVRSESGDLRYIASGKGGVEAKSLTLRLLEPRPASLLFSSDDLRSVQFSWRSVAKKKTTGPLSLEVATRRNFSEILLTRGFNPGSDVMQASLALPLGRYWWRLLESGQPATEVRQLVIARVPKITPVSPNPGEEVFQFGEGGPVDFRWTVQGGRALSERQGSEASHYLEVSTDPSFNQIVMHERVAVLTGKISLNGLTSGRRYYWRIQGEYPGAKAISATEDFHLSRRDSVEIALSDPVENQTVNAKASVRFEWDTSQKGMTYVWEIQPLFASAKDLNKEVLTDGNSVSVALPDSGRYGWRVTALDKDRSVGATAWRSLVVVTGEPIKLTGPSPNEEIYYWEKPSRFDFTWVRDADFESSGYSCHFVLAKNGEFGAQKVVPVKAANRVSSDALGLLPGQYSWKVRLVDSTGSVVRESPVWKFRYGVYPVLNAPEGVRPVNGSLISVGELSENPQLEWNPVPQAIGYEVILKQGQKVVMKSLTDSPRLGIERLQSGHYFWSVRALDPLRRAGRPMLTQSFQVDVESRQLDAPEETDWEAN